MEIPGLGIGSLVFRGNCSFFESERTKEGFALLKQRITLFVKSDKGKSLLFLFFKRATKVIHSFVLGIIRGNAGWKEQIWSFLFNAHSYKERITLLLSALLLFSKELREWIALVALYLKSYKSERAKSERATSVKSKRNLAIFNEQLPYTV